MLESIPVSLQYPLAPWSSPRKSKEVYFKLLDGTFTRRGELASQYLAEQLRFADKFECDLPDDPGALSSWMQRNADSVGKQYRAYLSGRKAGSARRYFPSKAHALYFLRTVAPTKMVDGAWLYGVVHRWSDARLAPLIRTYLEELGEGVASKNHVALYGRLLAANGCEDWQNLGDEYYAQGAIQLALAYGAGHFLPEVIGFNLGYEQLPLHLLITAYELNELGIDPYYFTLHLTVDNAGTGHAKKALDAAFAMLPRLSDADAFYRRVIDGYKLNWAGAGTTSIIESFDLHTEVVALLAAKSLVGKNLHSDYCRIAGRTVNEWLSDPAQIPAFLESLERNGMIKRNQNPQNSRFWKLIQGERAEMFGVFSAYEQQVIHDWIAGDWAGRQATAPPSNSPCTKSGEPALLQPTLTFRARQRLLDTLRRPSGALDGDHGFAAASDGDDFDRELCALEEKLGSTRSKDEAMALLVRLMSPGHHHLQPGLTATRIFATMLENV